MGRSYKQLTLEERCTLAQLHASGHSIRQIAAALDRAASTISRELRRNRGAGVRAALYRPAYADEQAWARRWSGSRLERQPALPSQVLNRLAIGWSPEQVAGRLARDHGRSMLSHESIYRFIYAQIRATGDYSWRLYLPRAKSKRGYRGRKGGASHARIKHRRPITARPQAVERRDQAGHWEADLMLFSNKKTNLLVAQERVSRFIFVAKQPDKRAARVAMKLQSWFATLPPSMRQTLTQDNGTEFAQHYLLNQKLGMETYFCDPHSPWQKGGVENANGRLRRFIPRKTNPDSLSHRAVQNIVNRYNHTPRKCLDFQTPAELFSKQLLQFKCESTGYAYRQWFTP